VTATSHKELHPEDHLATLSHARGAVNAQHLAVDPAAVVRCQEADDTSDVDRQTDTVARRPTSSVLICLLVCEVGAIGTAIDD